MPITYAQSGVRYEAVDPVKKHAQTLARSTAKNLSRHGAKEISSSRGESAYVWKQGNLFLASVVEGLGTKNLIADAMRSVTKKTYYDIVAHDTVACIVNDLVSVGATPLTLHAYWAVGASGWLTDARRTKDLVNGWKKACDISGVSWGGGETPVLAGIIRKNTIDLGGAAIGLIKSSKHLITDKKIRAGDRILFLQSSGVNANGLTLARALAKKLPGGYATRLPNGKRYGDALLTKSNIYARLIQNLQSADIDIHYLSNITGHGLRKIMRARQEFTYVIEKVFKPRPIFSFIQKHARLSAHEMYQTFNMGQDYAIFLPAKDVKKAQAIIKKNGFKSLNAGSVQRGKKMVKIRPLNLTYFGDSLDIR